MSPPQLRRFSQLVQSLLGELPNRLQHDEASLAAGTFDLTQQALLDQ